jgi:hypothetical protein
LFCANQQLSLTRFNRAHCFDRVQDQVQDDLLHLNAITLNGIHPLREAGLDGNAIFGDCASRQFNDLVDRRIDIKAIVSW